MSDELQTGVSSEGSTDAALTTPAASPDGAGTALAPDASQTAAALDTGTDNFSAIIDAIPVDDADLTGQETQPHYQALTQMRGQLRTLGSTLKELLPLREYEALGPLPTIKPKVELANLLYSPLTDARGQAVIDPVTQTPYLTTRPAIEFLDANSPGMPEQLLADLLDFEVTVDDRGTRRPLKLQVLDYWDAKFPNWWRNRYGAQIAPVTGAVSPEELAEIPSEYHEAYRRIPPSIRHAWAAIDEADRTRMLADYKRDVDREARETADQAAAAEQEARDNYARQQFIAVKQREYLQTIRQERYATMSQTLEKQIAFSADPVVNSIHHGMLGATLANLTDPDVDFIGKQKVLEPLGIKLDQKFEAALNRFYTNAYAKVAYEVAGDAVQTSTAETETQAAADQLAAKLGIIALAIAEKVGAQRAKAAAAVNTALNSATTVRPSPGTAAAPASTGGLPAGVRPDSPEALREIASRTNFVT